MKKYYDIVLRGIKMTDEQFEFLANNILLGGIKHRYHAKRIEYECYSNARTDLKEAETWLREQGYKPLKYFRNTLIKTIGDDYIFQLITFDAFVVPKK